MQNYRHITQAEFANPNPDLEDDPVITDAHVEKLETWTDDTDEELEPLASFILPGGSEVGARLHYARSVCRRTERDAAGFVSEAGVESAAVAYLNRFSDLLFTLARFVN